MIYLETGPPPPFETNFRWELQPVDIDQPPGSDEVCYSIGRTGISLAIFYVDEQQVPLHYLTWWTDLKPNRAMKAMFRAANQSVGALRYGEFDPIRKGRFIEDKRVMVIDGVCMLQGLHEYSSTDQAMIQATSVNGSIETVADLVADVNALLGYYAFAWPTQHKSV